MALSPLGPDITTSTQSTNAKIDDILGRSGNSVLTYPMELEGDGNHYAVFSNYQYQRANFDANATKREQGKIVLPMPDNLKTNYSQSFQTANLGVFKSVVDNAFDKAGSKLPQTVSSMNQATSAVSDMIGGVMSEGFDKIWGDLDKVGKDLVSAIWDQSLGFKAVINDLIGISANMALDKIEPIAYGASLLGLARNPNQALLFQGTNFRQHQFSYTFVARNQKESDALKQIIMRLKVAQAMSFFDGSDRNIFQLPDQWEIKFYHNGKLNAENLFNISMSVMTGLEINYAGQGGVPIFFEQTGAPFAVSIGMVFDELTITTRKEIVEENR